MQNVAEQVELNKVLDDVDAPVLAQIVDPYFAGVCPVHVCLEVLRVNIRKTHDLLLTLEPAVGARGSKESRFDAYYIFVCDEAELFRAHEYCDDVVVVTAGSCQSAGPSNADGNSYN